jgi:hypothetical protein
MQQRETDPRVGQFSVISLAVPTGYEPAGLVIGLCTHFAS